MNLLSAEPILLPVIALVIWTLIMQGWMVITRVPAMNAAGMDPQTAQRTAGLGDKLPGHVQWKADNYNHLMEQPTIFYAVVAVLVLSGDTSGVNLAAAWAYTGLRIAHSLWQGLVNVINVRVVLFTLSTVCLWVLAVNAVRRTVF